MTKKLGVLVSFIVLLLPMLAGVSVTANAAATEEPTAKTVTVNLHKRVFEEGQMPEVMANTGEEMTFEGTALKDVTFKAYDVTAQYNSLVKATDSKEAINTIVKDTENATTETDYVPAYAIQIGDKKVTDEEGLAPFTNLPIKKDGTFATYLFVETDSPTNISQKATPIVLTMPIYKGETDELNTNIHIYPKNERQTMLKKDLTDDAKKALKATVNGTEIYNAEIGKPFGYTISTLLPWNLADKSHFDIVDTPDAGMAVDTTTIKVAGLKQDTDYQVEKEATGRGYKLVLNMASEAVKELAGHRMTITYDAALTKDAVIDTGINNEAKVETGTTTTPNEQVDPPVQGPEIFTGGKSFVKKDEKSGKTLQGAAFKLAKVTKETGTIIAYATLDNGKYSWSDSDKTGTIFTSNDKGEFAVTGLEYSDKLSSEESYAMVEVKAPKNYVKLTKPFMFDVVKDEKEAVKKVDEITNILKGILPSTGGNGIYLFLAVGTILMAGALVWYRRTKVEAEI